MHSTYSYIWPNEKISIMAERRYSISSEELRDECLRRKYCELLSKPETFPSADNWDFIISRRMHGLGPGLYRKYLVSWLLDENRRCDYHTLAIRRFADYLKAVTREYAVETVYSDVESAPEATRRLIYECELFDSAKICDIVSRGNVGFAADLLGAYQPEYDGDTVDAMQYLLDMFMALPDLGSVEQHRGLFRTETVYICPDRHTNPADTRFCKCAGCGKDIKGLTENQRLAVDDFARRIDVIRDLLD